VCLKNFITTGKNFSLSYDERRRRGEGEKEVKEKEKKEES